MLVPVIFVLALLLTLGTALLEASRSAAQSASQTALARSADVALASGIARYTQGLAAYVAAYGPTHAPQLPSRSTPQAICAPADPPGACSLTATITARITAASGDQRNAGTDAIASAQTSALAEARLSAIVTATIAAADGTPRSARARLITYRVFAAPPYAVIAGERDAAAGGAVAATGPGDDGGATPAPTIAGTTADTRIHVQLVCRTVIADANPDGNQQHRANDNLPWGVAAGHAYEVPCGTATPAPADAFADEHWSSGDRTPAGWTP